MNDRSLTPLDGLLIYLTAVITSVGVCIALYFHHSR